MDSDIKTKIEKYLASKKSDIKYESLSISDDDFQTISIQLRAYGFINIDRYDSSVTWSLTEKGESVMMQNRVIKKG